MSTGYGGTVPDRLAQWIVMLAIWIDYVLDEIQDAIDWLLFGWWMDRKRKP